MRIIMLLLVLSPSAAAADGPCIIPGRGHFYIHAGTAGLFGALAHEHTIEAQKIDGCAVIDSGDITRSFVKLIFTTADIRVIDGKESPAERAKVQKTMEADVLRVAEYPRITFESTEIGQTRGNSLRVRGTLTIRGKAQDATLPVTLTRMSDGSLQVKGEYRFKQTTFGIQPIQLVGGTIKVKDEVRTEFELFLK
jgi:polyisoprenoid-binding protein YceI